MDVIKLGSVVVDFNKPLGEGGFGQVFEGIDEGNGRKVAAKRIKVAADDHAQCATSEIKNLLKTPAHKHVVRFIDFHFARNSFWLIIEYCGAGSLDSFFNKHAPVPFPNKVEFMCQIAHAISHLHIQKPQIVHRDLKPQNIMLHFENDKPIIKLTDFGLSKVAPNQMQTMQSVAQFSTKAGTPVFMAPELFSEQKYTAAVDIFSCGLVMLAMLEHEKKPHMIPGHGKGLIPMPLGMLMGMGTDEKTVVQFDSADNDAAKNLKGIILKAISKEPKDRPTSEQMKSSLQGLLSTLRAPSIIHDDMHSVGSPVADRMLPERRKRDEKPEAKKSSSDNLLELMCQLLAPLAGLGRDDDDSGKKADSEIRVGDKVQIDRDATKAIRLQEGHGGWNNAMRTALGTVGVVIKKIMQVFKVQCPDGNTWSFNPKLLTKLTADGTAVIGKSDFKTYDIVKVVDDVEKAESQQKGHGGWNKKMRFAVGSKGFVNKVDEDGDVLIECINGDTWTFNPASLMKIVPGKDFDPGDLVLISHDKLAVKKMQGGHGGWHPEMEKHLGKTATVQEVMKDDDILIRTGGKSDIYVYNKQSITLCAKKDEVIEAIAARRHTKYEEADNTHDRTDGDDKPFERGDIIKIFEDETMVKFLQAERKLEWDPKMRCVLGLKGIVNHVKEDGNVYIECINTLKFAFNPAALKQIPPGNVEKGALVLIPSDFELVKMLQESVGIWKGEMAECLGHSGTIKEVNGEVVKVDVSMGRGDDDPVWPFCSNALSVIASKDEIVEAILRKRVGEAKETD